MKRGDAKAAGLTRYFTGVPCPRGHIADRLVVNATCVTCVNEKQQERRAAGLLKALDKARYWRDPLGNNAKSKASYKQNIDKRRAYDKARNAEPERLASICRRSLEYAKRHPGRVNALTALRRARLKRATPPWLTVELLKEISAFYEAAQTLGMEVDHIVPLAGSGVCGLHVPWNLQHLSLPANRRKSNHYAEATE